MATLLDSLIPLGIYLAVWIGIFIIGVLVKADRFGLILKPYYFMLKTVAFNSWMERLGRKWRGFWLTFYDIGAAVGIGLTALAVYVFIRGLIALLTNAPGATGVALIVPVPGLVRLDILPYILLGIAVLLIPHEVAHGIASVLDRVPIKSSGVFIAVVLPGGFVEIDEEDLSKKANRTKLRVFAAGSFTNIVTWFLVLLLASAIFVPGPAGVLITNLTNNGGAQQAQVPQWSVITAINGTQISSIGDLSRFMSNVKAGQSIELQLSDGTNIVSKTVKTTLENSTGSPRALIGITSQDYQRPRTTLVTPFIGFQLSLAFYWLTLLLINVAIVNMLPLFPFDGDRYYATILNILGVKNTKWPRIVASGVSLSLLLLSIVISFVKFGTILLGT